MPKQALRRRAEALAREKGARAPENLYAAPEVLRSTLHELQVHQFELEMQNEELRRTQAELEASRARYFDLYDLAPVGYLTIGEGGLILQANLTFAKLLGVARSDVVNRPLSRFVLPEDQDIYYQNHKKIFETGARREWELRLLRGRGSFLGAGGGDCGAGRRGGSRMPQGIERHHRTAAGRRHPARHRS